MSGLIQRLFNGDKTSLSSRTIIAAFWSFIGSAGGGMIRFISNLILTRLLFPEAFGLMATAMVAINLVQLFSDTGVKTALIQNPRGTEKEYIDTAFIFSIIRSLILFVIIMVAAKPLAGFYGQSDLSTILFIMSGALIAEGLLNPAMPLIIKSLRIEKQVVYAIGSQLAGFLTTVILVAIMRSVVALAIGYFLTSVYRVLGSYLVIRYKPAFKWDKQAGKELFNFGKFIIINTMLGWAVVNIDRLVVGKVLGMEVLGYYNLALYIGLFSVDVLIQVFSQSYFPALSSISRDLDRVQETYRKTMVTVISLAVPFLTLLVIFHDEVITVLYDPRYSMAGVVLFWLGLKSIIHVVLSIQSSTMIALGKPQFVSLSNLAGLVFLVSFMPWFTANYGIIGSGVAALVSTLIISVIQSFFLISKLHFNMKTVMKPWFHLLVVVASIALLHIGIRLTFYWLSNSFILMVITGLASMAVLFLSASYYQVFGRKTVAGESI